MSTRRSSAPNPSKKEKEKEKRKREEPPNNDRSSQVRGSPRLPTPKFHNYAPLNAPQSQILMEIKDQLPPARRMFTPPDQRNSNKYCWYHQDHGHDMDEYLQLKDKIKHLICRGHLARFIMGRLMQPRPDVHEALPWENDNRPMIRTIHTIYGGPSRTNNQRA